MKRRVSNVRIVAGKFKGLRIPFKASRYIRTTTNKTKETIKETLKRLNLDTEPEYHINLFNLNFNLPIDKKKK